MMRRRFRSLGGGGAVAGPDCIGRRLADYPSLAAASGFAFFFLGSTYWGKCYIFAAIFFALAFAMIADLAWAPIEFGVTWAASLLIVGRRLEKLTKE